MATGTDPTSLPGKQIPVLVHLSVLGLDGRVVTVNTAILAEFGGSNIGVPAGAARPLLDRVEQDIR